LGPRIGPDIGAQALVARYLNATRISAQELRDPADVHPHKVADIEGLGRFRVYDSGAVQRLSTDANGRLITRFLTSGSPVARRVRAALAA
jgi:hypothetical protein